MRHELEETPQQIFNEVWKSIVIKKGEIDVEQVKLELSDYYYLMLRIAEVYCEVSGGRLSKPTHMAESILSEYQREMEESFELGEKEGEEQLKALKAEINTYIDAEKRNAGPNIGTVPQSKEDACRAARIAAFTSVLNLLEAVEEDE